MKQSDKYLLQSTGTYTFLAWMEQQKERGITCLLSNQTVYLPQTASKYFSLAVSKYKKHKYPFLCVQPNENAWMKHIFWDYVVIRKNDRNLYLVSKYIEGDGFNYPDLLPFAVAIEFDMKEKLEAISNFAKLDAREYFIDTDDTIRVNYHSKIFGVELRLLDENQDYMTDITQYILAEEEKRAEKNDSMISHYGTSVPTFEGNVIMSEEMKKLREKYK